ncbi:MAG TPA: 50S ribosomal protein L23 [Thermoanaerobaculia bacterium]|nr:50S ribosomal protein L23 [Thermoanaerobaculia bacterium]
MRTPQSVIVRPVLTEKSTALTVSQNVITFDVARDANKIQIRHAVETLFNVKVDSVRVVKVSGKIKKVGRSIGRAQDRKKAYVKLAAGQKPPAIFEGV